MLHFEFLCVITKEEKLKRREISENRSWREENNLHNIFFFKMFLLFSSTSCLYSNYMRNIYLKVEQENFLLKKKVTECQIVKTFVWSFGLQTFSAYGCAVLWHSKGNRLIPLFYGDNLIIIFCHFVCDETVRPYILFFIYTYSVV